MSEDTESIDELDLGARAYHCLQAMGITTIQRLRDAGDETLLRWNNFGRKSLKEVRQAVITWDRKTGRISGGDTFDVRMSRAEIEAIITMLEFVNHAARFGCTLTIHDGGRDPDRRVGTVFHNANLAIHALALRAGVPIDD